MSQPNFLLLAGSDLFPPTQQRLLANLTPRAQHTAQVPRAWLAFGRPGVPFAEPTTASVLLQGYNDLDAPSEDPRSEAFRKWVWARCAPGMEWEEGGEVPWLEGVIYDLSDDDWTAVHARMGGEFVSVEVHAFEGGDPAKRTGTYKAWLPAPPKAQLVAGLTPSLRVHRSVLFGAFLSPLSRPYIAHLTQFRHYSPTLAKRLYARLVSLWLLPGFLLFFLPGQLLRRMTGLDWGTSGGAVGRVVSEVGLFGMRVGERVGRGVVGSGWRNEVRR